MNKYYFLEFDYKLDDIINDDNNILLEVNEKTGEYILIYKNSRITLIMSEDGGDVIGFTLNSEDVLILRILFLKYGIYFYDEGVSKYLSFLNQKKDGLYIKNILFYYSYECMLHLGIIHNLEEFQNKICGKFKCFDEKIIHKGMEKIYRKIRYRHIIERFKKFLNF